MVDRKEQWNQEEKSKFDDIIDSSYSHFVRLERRNLLLVSSITIVSVITAISPQEASIAGITFQRFTPTIYYSVLLALITYFLTVFFIFFFPKYQEVISIRKKLKDSAITFEYSESFYSAAVAVFKQSDARLFLWLGIHYYLPLTIGCVAFLCALIMVVSSRF